VDMISISELSKVDPRSSYLDLYRLAPTMMA
jgi:hypothetical protein